MRSSSRDPGHVVLLVPVQPSCFFILSYFSLSSQLGIRAVDQGHPRAEIVRMFGVSLASIKRYLKQRRESGELSPKAIPGRPSKKYAALEAGLVAQLKAHPDSTLEAHCQLWESTHGMWVDHTTMSRAIRRVGWTRKKKRWVPLSATRRSEPPGEQK